MIYCNGGVSENVGKSRNLISGYLLLIEIQPLSDDDDDDDDSNDDDDEEAEENSLDLEFGGVKVVMNLNNFHEKWSLDE